MKKLIQELSIGSVSSAIGFWLIAGFHWKFLSNFQTSDRDPVFAGFFIGLPLGSILSLWFLNKFVWKEKRPLFKAVLLGVVLSFPIEILLICLIPIFGMSGTLVIPPLMVSTIFVASESYMRNKNKLSHKSSTG